MALPPYISSNKSLHFTFADLNVEIKYLLPAALSSF